MQGNNQKNKENKKITFRIPVFTFGSLYLEALYQLIINTVLIIILFTRFNEIYYEGLNSIIMFSIVFTLGDQFVKQILIRYPKIIIYSMGIIFTITQVLLFMIISEKTISISFNSVGIIVALVFALNTIKMLVNIPIRNIIRNKYINKIIRRIT